MPTETLDARHEPCALCHEPIGDEEWVPADGSLYDEADPIAHRRCAWPGSPD